MGLAGSEWVFDRVGGNTPLDQGAIHTKILESRMSEFDCRSGENASKGSNRQVISGDRPVCGTFVPEAKERWVTAARVQSETPQCLCKIQAFQDVGHSNGIRFDSEQRLAGKDRLERCLFCSEHGRTRQEVPEVLMGSRSISSGHAHSGWGQPENVHKALEASHSDVEEEWGPGSYFLGGHDIDPILEVNYWMWLKIYIWVKSH